MGFDDNMVGLSAGSQNVCMLAAFGNGGVVPQNCVPIIGTQAESWPEQWLLGQRLSAKEDAPGSIPVSYVYIELQYIYCM